MDRHTTTNHPTNIGNTNRRFKFNQNSPSSNLNYQPSTTYSINFSLPASENIIHRPYLPGLKKTKTTTQESQLKKDLYNSSLNKYKLLEKELDKRKKEQQQQSTSESSSKKQHSQSYSNIFSNKSPQFINRDKNSQLAKPNLIRSNATTNYEQTNSLNDLYKVENLFNSLNQKKDVLLNSNNDNKDNKSKSIEFMRLDNKLDYKLDRKLDNKLVDKSCNTSFDTNLDDKLNNNYIDKIINKIDDKKANQINNKHYHHNINNNNNNLDFDLKPKIILTEPSIDLDKSAIEPEKLFKSTSLNRLNVYSVKKQELQESEKKILKSNQNWFSWFKIILTFNDKDSEQKTIKDMIFYLIKKWYRELVLITILLICIFNAIRTSQLNTRKTKLPTKFLPDNQLIKEYEFGDLQELSTLAFQNEVTFVMYYAPWNAECIEFKNEYLKISKYYKDQGIFFAAVNCWYPDGECSKSYRIKKFPVFIAHIRNIGEVEYRGPSVASYLIPFLENLLNPVKSIVNEADLLDLKSKHDGVAVGYFDFYESTNPINYKHFLLASIKSLFQDPFRKVQFAIVSSKKTAIKLEIEDTQSVHFYTWNSTYRYKNKLKKVDNFLKWIYSTLDEDGPLIEWITPTTFKTDTLSVKLLSEPTLILFTPRSLILNISPYYDILREVAMDYYNCDNSPQIKSLIHRIILRRKLKEEKLFELEEKCHEITQLNSNADKYIKLNLPKDFKGDDICCHHQLMNWKLNGKIYDKKCYCTACVNINKKLCPSSCKKFNCLATASRYLISFDPIQFNNTINYCNDIKSTYHPKYTPYYNIEMSCSGLKQSTNDNDDEYKLKLSNSEKESINTFTKYDNKEQQKNTINYVDESMERMLKNFEEHHCRRLNLGLNYNDFNFPTGESSSSSQKWRHNFTGLGCRTNKTLGFIAIDSLMYQSFLEGLGIDAFNETHTTVIMIVEAEEENIYVLNHHITKKDNEVTTINKKIIYEFIKDYNDSRLRRYLRSPLDKMISSSDSCLNKTDEQGRRIICVPEITTNTFNEIVLDDKKDVLLLFYAPWCGFCHQIASIFLTVARFFTNIDGIVFARINADQNDLPFEYTVNRYPTLILFPAGKKMDSVTFPLNMPITATSLLQFVLANVQDKVKYQASFQLCNKQCLERNVLQHHMESKELSLGKLRLIKKINELKNSLISNSKNKNLKKILNDFLLIYSKMLRGKESKYQLFNNLKEILSNRISNFDEELTGDLNNQLINDMINLLNSPIPSKIQETKSDRKDKIKSEKTLKSTKKSKSKKSINKKDEL